tara:strand:- start:526 stop:1536 length:1011 start_codon:yes stop_codon:yes gene_type:complete
MEGYQLGEHKMAKKIIIDTDPAMGTKGGDPEDCFAIMLAMNSPEVEILGITTVQGNVPVERGFSNASYLVEHLKKNIPVHTGRPGTYDKARNEKRKWLSQRKEMEQITPMLSIDSDTKGAPQFIVETCIANSGDIELVTIGPLTNIAQALVIEPSLSEHVNKITMMAGAATVQGNVTPAAEFNIWADPESASVVFKSGIPIRMVPLDVCHKTRFGREHLNQIGKNKHSLCQFVQESVDPWLKINPNQDIIDQGLHLYDSLAVALCFLPDLAEYKEAFVSVETQGEFTDGETVCEFNNSIMGQIFKPKPNTEIALELDIEGFNRIFEKRVIDFLSNL